MTTLELFTSDDLAETQGRSPSSVRQHIARGLIPKPTLTIRQGAYFWTRQALERAGIQVPARPTYRIDLT